MSCLPPRGLSSSREERAARRTLASRRNMVYILSRDGQLTGINENGYGRSNEKHTRSHPKRLTRPTLRMVIGEALCSSSSSSEHMRNSSVVLSMSLPSFRPICPQAQTVSIFRTVHERHILTFSRNSSGREGVEVRESLILFGLP